MQTVLHITRSREVGLVRRVFVTGDIGERALDRLRAVGYQVEVYPGPEAPSRSVLEEVLASGIDGLVTTIRDSLDSELLAVGAHRLRVVCQYAVGYDNLDMAAATRLGIPVTNTPDVLSAATAEFAFFLMGSVARKLVPSEALVRDGNWRQWHPYLPFLGDEVTGKTVAVIGAGRIGRLFADCCLSLEMDLLLHSRRPIPDVIQSFQDLSRQRRELGFSQRAVRIEAASFDLSLREADFVSLHLPLTDETRGLLGWQAFRKMKKGAYLINTARGPIVDEAALCRALLAREIAGAALDVFETEPLEADSPLRDPRLKDRLRLFHHFGSGGTRTRLSPDPDVGMAGRCVQGVIDVLESNDRGDLEKIPHIVNREGLLGKGKSK